MRPDHARAGRPELPLVQVHPDTPEQRIGRLPQVAHQRADTASLYQPSPAARVPQPSGLAHEGSKVAGAPDGHHGAEHLELAGTDAHRNRREPRATYHATSVPQWFLAPGDMPSMSFDAQASRC